MSGDKLAVITVGVSLIFLICWFFFAKKEVKQEVKKTRKRDENVDYIDIVVDGGYKPAVIFLRKGIRSKLKILRKDPNTCLSDIILPDFKISAYLPLNKVVEIDLLPEKQGEFPFQCGMNMFHGKIVVD